MLVDTADPEWGFELRPTVDGAGGRRTYQLRAASEQERLEWAERLLSATLLSRSWRY